MMTIYSPNNIDVLLHCHLAATPHPRREAPAVADALDEFQRLRAIEPDPDLPGVFRTTAMGEAWVQSLCNVPPPRSAFIDEQGRVLKVL